MGHTMILATPARGSRHASPSGFDPNARSIA
jgi:hypothetical protein